jgi:hypothetical protein
MLTDIGALSTGIKRPVPETGDPRASSVKVENALTFTFSNGRNGGHAVAQLVEALRYKPEGRGFNSRWCHWNF